MTTKEIQLLVGKMQVLKYHSPVVENMKALNKYEFDVMSIGGGNAIYEFEVKISRSDFLKPKEKEKQQTYLSRSIGLDGRVFDGRMFQSIPNYFSYCCPKDLIGAHELSINIGLYYSDNGTLECIREPKRLHNVIFNIEKIKEKILRYYSERTFLGVCRMTYDNKIAKELAAKHEKEREEHLKAFLEKHKNKIPNLLP